MTDFPADFISEFLERTDHAAMIEHGRQMTNMPPHELATRLDKILETCRSKVFVGGVLPRLKPDNVYYYLLAKTPREWRALRPLALAFVGPTITSFRGAPNHLIKSDSAEQLLLEQNFHAVARIGVPKGVNDFERKKVVALAAIHRLAELGLSRNPAELQRIETTSELLERFEFALSARDRDSAEDILGFLRQGRRLDALNLKFMEIELLARFENWREIVDLPTLVSLCLTRRPDRITCSLVEALYRIELMPFERELNKLKEIFLAMVLRNTGDLFERLPRGAGDCVLKAFAVYVWAYPSDHESLRRRLSQEASKSSREEFAEFWSRLSGAVMDPADQHASKFQNIVRIPPPPDIERASVAMVAAFQEEDIAMAKAVVAFVSALNEKDRATLIGRGKYQVMWRHLHEIALSGWLEWLASIDNPDFVQYREVAARAIAEWPIRDELNDEHDARLFKEAMAAATKGDTGLKRLVNCLPLLFGWVLADDRLPEPTLIPVYLELLEYYALGERLSDEGSGSFAILFEGVISCGPDEDDYARAMDTAMLLVEKVNAAKAVDWLIDIVEAAADHQAPLPGKRESLFWTVLNTINRMRARISDWQVEALKRLAQLLGVENDPRLTIKVAETRSVALGGLPPGLSVAIYTLTESAGRRAMGILSQSLPNTRFTLNCDPVGSTALKHLARETDVFIVATRSAKHAATEFIGQNRPKDKPILYPAGKGSSSILTALRNWANP